MALVPLKQIVTIERLGEVDEWGEGKLEQFDLKCRVDEGAKLVKNRQGVEVVSSAQILFNKLPDIRIDDYIIYTNELGVTLREKPISIAPIRMINGKPTLTEVSV